MARTHAEAAALGTRPGSNNCVVGGAFSRDRERSSAIRFATMVQRWPKEDEVRIFDYAKVADWEDRLQKLANMAEQERWTYRAVPSSSPVPVLDAYVRYTFMRVHEQQRIAEVAELACFNTGLLGGDLRSVSPVGPLRPDESRVQRELEVVFDEVGSGG